MKPVLVPLRIRWILGDAHPWTSLCTEKELEELTVGTIRSIEDLDEWKDLVAMVGLEDATQTIRTAIQSQQSE